MNGPTRLAAGTEAAVRQIVREVIREELRALMSETVDASGRERDLTESDIKETAFSAVGETAVVVLLRMTCEHRKTYQYIGEPPRCASCGKAVPADATPTEG